MFEGIPKELPQIFHMTQDFFMANFCSRQTISIKTFVLYREKMEMKFFHFFAWFPQAKRASFLFCEAGSAGV
ncbi:TPA: hypothetical protein I4G64_20545 [Enterobacter cloacae]|nr:hypothetical protein [Enterobacter pasteurii]